MVETFSLQLLLLSFSGGVNRQQQVLEYLVEEPRPKGAAQGRALLLTDDQRQGLAAKGKRIGRRLLMQVATIVTQTRSYSGISG